MRVCDTDHVVNNIAQGSAFFFQQLMDSATLGEASAAAMVRSDGFDLTTSLGILICHGALSAWHTGSPGE